MTMCMPMWLPVPETSGTVAVDDSKTHHIHQTHALVTSISSWKQRNLSLSKENCLAREKTSNRWQGSLLQTRR